METLTEINIFFESEKQQCKSSQFLIRLRFQGYRSKSGIVIKGGYMIKWEGGGARYRDTHTIYQIGNIFCLEISGGCEGPAAHPVSAPECHLYIDAPRKLRLQSL